MTLTTPPIGPGEDISNGGLENFVEDAKKEEITVLNNNGESKDALIDKFVVEIADDILSSKEIQHKIEKVKKEGTETRIPNIGNYDLGSTIRDEFKKALKIYARYRNGEKEPIAIYKKNLEDIAKDGLYQNELGRYAENLEKIIESNKKKFVSQIKALVKLLTTIRIISWERIAEIRYKNAKHQFHFFKEGNRIHYNKNLKNIIKDGIFIPKDSINIHVAPMTGGKSKGNITKAFLESFGLIKKYLIEHPGCPGFFMDSRLIYDISINKPLMAARGGLTKKNTILDQKNKLGKVFVSRDSFLLRQDKTTIQPE